MKLLLLFCHPSLLGPLQREIESGSVIGLRLGPDRASMFLNDPMHGGQTHSGSFKFRVGVEALEYAEQSLGVFHVEASAVIAHENDCRFTRLLDAVDFDHGAGLATGVLQSIVQ